MVGMVYTYVMNRNSNAGLGVRGVLLSGSFTCVQLLSAFSAAKFCICAHFMKQGVWLSDL